MSVDLEQSLAELARSVGDDATAERMTGQVRHMVSRIRRRRAARHAANGVVGVGAAAAVTFGAVQLGGRPVAEAPPVAGQSEDPAAQQLGACGAPPRDAAQELSAGSGATGLGLEAPPAEGVSGSTVDVAGVSPGSVVLLRDGVVVTEPGVTEGPVTDSFPGHATFELSLVACDTGRPLAPGPYELHLTGSYAQQDGRGGVEVRGVTVPFTVLPEGAMPQTDPTNDPAAEAEAAAAASLAALVADAPTGTFPSCGSAVPPVDDRLLALDLALEDRTYAPGETLATDVILRTTSGRHVIGNAPTTGAHIVLATQGVVVGTVHRDPEDVDLVDLGPDDSTPVRATGALALCTTPMTDGAQLPLPRGTYQAYAVMDVMLKEVTTADGEASSVTETSVAVSDPVDVTVG